MGFKISEEKLKLGSSDQYYKAILNVQYAETDDAEYISAAIFQDVLEPEQLAGLVEKTFRQPDAFLNEGFGRYLLAAIRRMRLNDEIAKLKNYPLSPLDKYREIISNSEEKQRAVDLIREYADKDDEQWRMIWLIYLWEDMFSYSAREAIEEITTMGTLPDIVRLWAKKKAETTCGLNHLHECSYLEAGECFGGE